MTHQTRPATLRLPLLVGLLLLPTPALPCTTFLLQSDTGIAFGKSYDWHQGQGMVLLNPRGLKKQALILDPRDRPARWTSKHASITFNQYGREFPNGGMNDAGLVVEIMWLEESRYPARDERPVVNELQWIQYQLDRYASVAEMKRHAEELRVVRASGRVHYLACDASGDCAAFEYLRGRLMISPEARTLTNHSFAHARRHLRRLNGQIPRSSSSLDRFARARHLAGAASEKPVTEAAFGILESVSIARYTQWQIVYEPRKLEVQFRSAASPGVKRASLAAARSRCAGGALMMNVDGPVEWQPYDAKANAALVKQSLQKMRRFLPPGTEQKVAQYPATTTCLSEAPLPSSL